MRKHRETILSRGHRVTSRWLDVDPSTMASVGARVDLEDIRASQVLIAFTEEASVGYTTGGRHVELGYAIALGLQICLVGRRENVFCHLPGIEVFESLESAVASMANGTGER